MMARRLSSVAARNRVDGTSAGAAGGRPLGDLGAELASTAGHRPSMAESQSGRTAGAARWIQAGSAAARATSPG